MRFPNREYLPGVRLAAVVLLTASLLPSGIALAQNVKLDPQNAGANNPQSPVQSSWVMTPAITGKTLPLYELTNQFSTDGVREAEQVKRPGRLAGIRSLSKPNSLDNAVQTSFGPMVSVTAGLSFDGVGQGFVGPNGTYSVGFVPPDTDMAVGTTQVISLVNAAFAVFDKGTGAVLSGPFHTNVLWSALGASAAC